MQQQEQPPNKLSKLRNKRKRKRSFDNDWQPNERERKRRVSGDWQPNKLRRNSPDNVCKNPDAVRLVLTEITKLMQQNPSEWALDAAAIDMARIVTVQNSGNTISCHGVILFSNGQSVEGTLTNRPNAAGDQIAIWTPGHWEPPLPPETTEEASNQQTTPPAITSSSASQSNSFHRGLADRTAWETWFDGLDASAQRGASFWASQRSLSHPGNCTALTEPEAIQACTTAKIKLRDSDILRKSDPDYRRGWNSYELANSADMASKAQAQSSQTQGASPTLPSSSNVGATDNASPMLLHLGPARVDSAVGATICPSAESLQSHTTCQTVPQGTFLMIMAKGLPNIEWGNDMTPVEVSIDIRGSPPVIGWTSSIFLKNSTPGR